MGRNKAKKNYLEDMDRDFNNAKLSYEFNTKKGWATEPLNEVVGQITLDAIAYLSAELVAQLTNHIGATEVYEESNLAVLRLNEPWVNIVTPAIEDEFQEKSKSVIAKEVLDFVTTLSDEEVKLVENEGREMVSVLTTESFDPIREFYERNTA